MALSFKFPKLGKARSNEAPLTITEDAPLLQPRAATSTAEKSATQQMKKLGGIFALLLWRVSHYDYLVRRKWR